MNEIRSYISKLYEIADLMDIEIIPIYGKLLGFRYFKGYQLKDKSKINLDKNGNNKHNTR